MTMQRGTPDKGTQTILLVGRDSLRQKQLKSALVSAIDSQPLEAPLV